MSQRLPLADFKFISDFAAFCRSKGDEEYDYYDPRRCACCRFLNETGRASVYARVIEEGWRDGPGVGWNTFPPGLDLALKAEQQPADRTFSALADRLESLISDSPVGVVS